MIFQFELEILIQTHKIYINYFTILAKSPWDTFENTQKSHTLYTSLHVDYEKLWYCCFYRVQVTPLPQTMLTTKAPINGAEIDIARWRGGGGGGVCIVKRMRNLARAFAKVSQDVWPGLY